MPAQFDRSLIAAEILLRQAFHFYTDRQNPFSSYIYLQFKQGAQFPNPAPPASSNPFPKGIFMPKGLS
jgi:hypothetical protein